MMRQLLKQTYIKFLLFNYNQLTRSNEAYGELKDSAQSSAGLDHASMELNMPACKGYLATENFRRFKDEMNDYKQARLFIGLGNCCL